MTAIRGSYPRLKRDTWSFGGGRTRSRQLLAMRFQRRISKELAVRTIPGEENETKVKETSMRNGLCDSYKEQPPIYTHATEAHPSAAKVRPPSHLNPSLREPHSPGLTIPTKSPQRHSTGPTIPAPALPTSRPVHEDDLREDIRQTSIWSFRDKRPEWERAFRFVRALQSSTCMLAYVQYIHIYIHTYIQPGCSHLCLRGATQSAGRRMENLRLHKMDIPRDESEPASRTKRGGIARLEIITRRDFFLKCEGEGEGGKG